MSQAVPEAATDTDRQRIARATVELLYRNTAGGLPVTIIAVAGLIGSVRFLSAIPGVSVWVATMAIVLIVRVLDGLDYLRRRSRPEWDPFGQRVRFEIGVCTTAAVWAAFPLVFWHELSLVQRVAIDAIYAAMVGGSLSILAASRRLMITYCAALTLPVAVLFLASSSGEGRILGGLGITFFFTMLYSSGVNNTAIMRAIRLSDELLDAQAALRETLASLEDRIRARTVDLEREVAERIRANERLAELATHDALTGLLNRTAFGDRLVAMLAEAERENGRATLLFVDLDNFKDINDALGHHIGDRILVEVTRRLRAALPADGFCGRWGGDEFVIGFRNEVVGGVSALGARIWRSACDTIEVEGEHVRVDAAIGVAVYPDHGSSAGDLIGAADMAMYAAKQSGRGRVRVFEHAMADSLGKRRRLEGALRDALATDQLSLEFQPVVLLADGRIHSLEALARWNDRRLGPISPGDFIPVAERTGDIIALGRWALRTACRAAASWTGERPPAVAVNVSVAQIVAGSLLTDVRAALALSGLDPHRLHLEVTESLFAGELEQTLPTLKTLRAMGVTISLDDFGTGFSSLGYLRSLPIDILKIDKSFVAHIAGETRPIVEAIRWLARSFGLAVIAEGVESVEQLTMLQDLGVHFVQGFYLSRPLPAGAVQAAIDAAERSPHGSIAAAV
jgi:diguanylate cyclase (GGDEF)-like protein